MLLSAEGQYRRQAEISATTAAAVRRLWRRLGVDFSADWLQVQPKVLTVLEAGRAASVVTALPYTAAALAEQGVSAPREAAVDPVRFMQSAPSGAPVAVVAEAPVVRTKLLVGQGVPVAYALEQGASMLAGIALTLLADTRRSVYGVDMMSRPSVGGYVRMLQAPSCSRCAILAGKFYRWNDGFLRHPRCDCQHVPVAGKKAANDAGLISDPYEYFNSLSREEQAKVFGKAEAQAIRDGADIYRVQNVRQRGLSTAIGRGKNRQYATMTVDDIYRTAGNRTNAIRMLEQQGYIKPRGQIVSQAPEIYSTPISRPIVAGSKRDRVLTARTTGVRDPLDRATMTAAERRLYDAWYRLRYAETFGASATSIGANSMTRFELPKTLHPGQLDALQEAFESAWREAMEQGYSQSLFDLAELLEGAESLPTRVVADPTNWRP